jgi:hypothetical protein
VPDETVISGSNVDGVMAEVVNSNIGGIELELELRLWLSLLLELLDMLELELL